VSTRRMWRVTAFLVFSALMAGLVTGRAQQNLIPVKVEMLTRAISKLPVLIAYDKGLYRKYGLDVQLWMPKSEFPGAIEMDGPKMIHPEFSVDGGVPMIESFIEHQEPRRVAIASTDCELRFDIVGQKGMKGLEEIRGKRLGISEHGAMTDFVSRAFAKRMGWQIGRDVTIVEHAQRLEDLKAGKADAFVADERYMALARQGGYPILADTSTWNQSIAGNSVRVEPEWIKDPKNRDVVMRFLKGTVEGVAIFMNDRDEALRVLAKYHGVNDPKVAADMYEEGLKMPRKPYPCTQGFQDFFAFFDSPELRKYKASDFYDESFMKELDQGGFIDTAYRTMK
jgi:ABC-type nitrate/sulfonate/bicarbonate transport system substrate-binding protein